jgi:hypothetical protein
MYALVMDRETGHAAAPGVLSQMQQVNAPDADYESNWATATFSLL